MRTFTERELRAFWKLLKAKWKKKDMMDFFQLTAEEATEMYKQAEQLHGGGYRELKQKQELTFPEPDENKEPHTYERPAAVYSNRTREQVIDELEKKEL
jgi:hypothetical protein